MQLNTKMAFPAKIFKLFKEENQDTLELYYSKGERTTQRHNIFTP
jgi:hypothetical protein